MNNAKGLWMLPYQLADKTNEQRILECKNIIKYLEIINNNNYICNSFEQVFIYFSLLNAEYQIRLLKIMLKLANCHSCSHCCKRHKLDEIYIEVWDEAKIETKKYLLEIKSDIKDKKKILNNLVNRSSNEIKEVSVIIPDFLSASSFLQPSIDILNVMQQLRKNYIEARYIDNRIEHLSFARMCKEVENSKFIVITTTPYDHIQNYFLDYRLKLTFELINYIKKHNPNIIIIVCGAHGSIRPDLVMKECQADFIIRGEYDFIIPEVINNLYKNTYDERFVYSRLDFINNKKISTYIHNNDAYLKGIQTLPAYDLVNFKRYYGDKYEENYATKQKGHAIILASRGCKNKCSFCFNFWGNDVRYRDPISIVDEMEILERKYNIKDIFFIDSTFTQNMQWTYEICKEIKKRKLTVMWSAETRCDKVNLPLLQEMKSANCYALWFGVESFCSCILKDNNKYNNEKFALEAIDLCNKAGIKPYQFILVGLPGETKYTLLKTIEHLKSIKEAYTESVMVAVPRFGTKYYEMAKKQYPNLGNDFYSLAGVRGLVNNEMNPKILEGIIMTLRNRKFNYSNDFYNNLTEQDKSFILN